MRRLSTRRLQFTSSIAASLLAFSAVFATQARAQDANVLFPISVIEHRLRDEPLVVLDVRGSRMAEDRTQRVVLTYPDSSVMIVKWAKSARGGSAFNNEPRYEIAAYELQKLFLSEDEYVVPPTIGRAVPVDWLKQYDSYAAPTFDGLQSTVLVLQYWLSQVTPDSFYMKSRFETDTVYARHLANFNILTHLVRHNDANVGNFLVSQSETNPRVFAVDNGVAFRSPVSDRGYVWRDLRVDRLPRATVERMRAITLEDLHAALGVLVHFDIHDGQLMLGEPTANLGDNRGVRRTREAVQLGLTGAEIRDVHNRLRRLLERVDQGRIQTF